MKENRIGYLLQRYNDDHLTGAEMDELYGILRAFEEEEEILAWLEQSYAETTARPIHPDQWEPVLQQILQSSKPVVMNPRKLNRMWWMAAAAIIVVVVTVTAFFLTGKQSDSAVAKRQVAKPEFTDRSPGGDKAVLTLADGRQVMLDSAGNGAVAKQGGITVINLDGQLAYQPEGQSTEVLYNTVTTPRGGQYQLVLADGSKVWLNAASSLRFPTGFPGSERTVELMGEGYFEVAHNAAKPFHVRVLRYAQDDNPMDVQVLGTHFNINSYGDEPAIKTTLLEGRVKVNKGGRGVYLNPGQQAVVRAGQRDIRVDYRVDVEQVVAWKNGMIYFDGADVSVVMRQISRWYSVDVAYTGDIDQVHLSGKVSRSLNLSQVIKVLEELGIGIRNENGKLVATPRL
ncbi:MAG: FecR family protein [Flavisolibacter sp.]